jgi:hypothetical protein
MNEGDLCEKWWTVNGNEHLEGRDPDYHGGDELRKCGYPMACDEDIRNSWMKFLSNGKLRFPNDGIRPRFWLAFLLPTLLSVPSELEQILVLVTVNMSGTFRFSFWAMFSIPHVRIEMI